MEFNVGKITKKLNSEIFRVETGFDLYTKSDGNLYINGCKTQKEAEELLAAHNPIEVLEPSVNEKLASVGLSIDDLKEALGI